SGLNRPFIWNPHTSERIDLDLPELTGDVLPLDWSPDGKRLLLFQLTQAVQQLYLYELKAHSLTKLDHPSGTFGLYAVAGTYFGTEGEIFAQWQAAAHPSQLMGLDVHTGRRTRIVLAAGDAPPGH